MGCPAFVSQSARLKPNPPDAYPSASAAFVGVGISVGAGMGVCVGVRVGAGVGVDVGSGVGRVVAEAKMVAVAVAASVGAGVIVAADTGDEAGRDDEGDASAMQEQTTHAVTSAPKPTISLPRRPLRQALRTMFTMTS